MRNIASFTDFACEKGHLACAQLLLQRGADKFVALNDGTTPLHVAARKGNTEMLRWLLEEVRSLHFWLLSVEEESPLSH